MYFLDLKGLVNQHIEKGITPSEQFKYVFGFVLLGLIGNGAPTQQRERDMLSILIVIFILAVLAGIMFIVLRHFYNKNGGENGQDFVLRLFTISWVITWRLFLAYIPLALIMLIAAFFQMHPIVILGIALLMSVGSIVYYLKKMSASLEQIHKRKDKHPSLAAAPGADF